VIFPSFLFSYKHSNQATCSAGQVKFSHCKFFPFKKSSCPGQALMSSPAQRHMCKTYRHSK